MEGVGNDQVTHADMKLFVEAVVKLNPLCPRVQLKDLENSDNLRKFMKSLSPLVDKKADMCSSNAFHIPIWYGKLIGIGLLLHHCCHFSGR